MPVMPYSLIFLIGAICIVIALVIDAEGSFKSKAYAGLVATGAISMIYGLIMGVVTQLS